MTTNEYALKAAQAIHDYVERCPEGEFSMVGLEEIITRTALEPATRELREALQGLLTTMEEGYGWTVADNCICEVDGKGNHAPNCPQMRARAVLAKYPAKEEASHEHP